MRTRNAYLVLASLAAVVVMTGELAKAASSVAPSQQTITCVGREASLTLQIDANRLISVSIDGGLKYVENSPTPFMELPDQTLVYEFKVDDSYDTNTYYNFGLLNGEINGRQIFQNGNDSDTYEGWFVAQGDDAFVCESETK